MISNQPNIGRAEHNTLYATADDDARKTDSTKSYNNMAVDDDV